MMESFSKRQKAFWKKEKLLFISCFYFSNRVVKRLRVVLQTHKCTGLFGKGLRMSWSGNLSKDFNI